MSARKEHANYFLSTKKVFGSKRITLHRYTWIKNKGDIPFGFHIHHVDGNTANNEISNLRCVSPREHIASHWSKERSDFAKKNIKNVIKKASEWSRTKEGKRRRNEIGKNNAHFMLDRPIKTLNCDLCGNEFNTRGNGQDRWCHKNCRQKALRWSRTRLQSENEKWYVPRKWNSG